MKDETRRMKDESWFGFDLFHHRHKNCNKFVGFLEQELHLLSWHNLGLCEKFQSVKSLVKLLQTTFDFVDKVGI